METYDAIQREKDIKAYGEINGTKIVSFEDQIIGNTASMARGGEFNGDFHINQNGTIGRTPSKYASVNTNIYYDNRFKKDKDKIIVVIDPRACIEHTRGKVYARQVSGHVIKRNPNTKKLELVKTIMVNSDDFIENYTNKLDVKTMQELAPLFNTFVGSVTESSMPI